MNKVPIKITATKTNKRDKKSDPSKWYVHKTKILLAAMFYKTAGGVGRIICTKEVGKSTLVKLNVSEELLLDD